MDSPETKFTKTADGIRIAYQTLGRGLPDVLKLAAYYSNIEHDWTHPTFAHVNRSLSELGRLIVLDGRGMGRSDRLSAERLPTLEERIDDLRAVLDEVQSERTVLVSFADSGPLCCLFAAMYPQRTHALILCNTRPRIAWAPDYPWGMTPDEFQRELEATQTRWGTREYATEMLGRAAPSAHENELMITWWEKSMQLSASPAAAAELLRLYYDMDVREVLPAIQAPTLVLASAPVAAEGAVMAERIPGAELRTIASNDPTVQGNPEPFLAEIRGFVERLRDEEADLNRVLATVLFTDIVSSTQRAAEIGDRAWRGLVERHHGLVRGMLSRWRGREIDTAGDGFFAIFDGPARAIRCAKAIVSGVRAFGLEIRAGLHTGEVETIDGKIGGIAVNIGARIAALAGPSQVLVSQTVKDLVAGSGLAFEEVGEHVLKGVPDRWRVYQALG